MSEAHRRYLRIEMAVSAVINAVLSLAFVLLLFGGAERVGAGALVVDAAPQSLMVALMSTLVPTLLTRRRVRSGAIAPLASRSRLPRPAWLRAVLVAAVVAGLAVAVHALVLPAIGTSWSFVTVLIGKTVYGAVLGAAVARFALLAALSDT